MKVKAKHWLNHDGVWHSAGEIFEISTADAEALMDSVQIFETPVTTVEVDETDVPKRRGRPKRTDADGE